MLDELVEYVCRRSQVFGYRQRHRGVTDGEEMASLNGRQRTVGHHGSNIDGRLAGRVTELVDDRLGQVVAGGDSQPHLEVFIVGKDSERGVGQDWPFGQGAAPLGGGFG